MTLLNSIFIKFLLFFSDSQEKLIFKICKSLILISVVHFNSVFSYFSVKIGHDSIAYESASRV